MSAARDWRELLPRIEQLAAEAGLKWHPVDFEAVPESFMMEISVYGLPVRMPHWSFGVRYISQLIQHRMGHSRLFEVVFPGNPGRAYLARGNSLAESVLVAAHVLGHADFSTNNLLFRRSQSEVSDHIVETAAGHAFQIAQAIEEHGARRVEQILDTALALEQHIEPHRPLQRERYAEYLTPSPAPADGRFRARFESLGPDTSRQPHDHVPRRAPVPPHPEKDLLWFLAQYAPDLEGWERDIFLAVREESHYFYPVFATQIMNEGWASYWHARLLREASFLPQDACVDAIKCHSDVVRPHASGEAVALSINPYHVGFTLWERIVEEQGLEAARRIMQEDDDFAFIRNHLTVERARELKLFTWREESGGGALRVKELDLPALHDLILGPRYNFGAPSIAVRTVRVDGTLELQHDHKTDGRGLDTERATRVLEYIQRIWRRPVRLRTVDERGIDLDVAVVEAPGG